MQSRNGIRTSLKLCIGSLILLISGLASAVPIVNYSGGVATGISNLNVSGTTYNVNFVFGSYNSVFGASTPTFLGDFAGADAAANAMMAAFNAEAVSPRIGNGSALGVLWSVYSVGATSYLATQVGYQPSPWQRFGNFTDNLTSDRTNLNWGFAVFTKVPEPATLMLFGLGLAFFDIARRKLAK